MTHSAEVRAGEITEIEVTLETVWDARSAGFLSGDHHFHLNYGGPFGLDPEDLPLMMRGENLDVATPLLANLHTRFEDQKFWGWEKGDDLAADPFRSGSEVTLLGPRLPFGHSHTFLAVDLGSRLPGLSVQTTDLIQMR